MNIKKTLFGKAKTFLDEVKFGATDVPYQTVLGLIKQFGWEEEFNEYLKDSDKAEVNDTLSVGLANGDTLLIETKGHDNTGVWISIVTANGNKIDIANTDNYIGDPNVFSISVVNNNSVARFYFEQSSKYNDCYVDNECVSEYEEE